jgi:hydrogenase expression/formation protein HypC
MCLGIPGEIIDVRDDTGLRIGKVRFAGITRDVCLDYVPDAAVGEYVLVHVGFAISKIDPEEAARTYRVLEEIGQTGELTADREPMERPS